MGGGGGSRTTQLFINRLPSLMWLTSPRSIDHRISSIWGWGQVLPQVYDSRSFPGGVRIAPQPLPASGADAGSAEASDLQTAISGELGGEAHVFNGMMAGAPTLIAVLTMCALAVMWITRG